MIRGASGRRPSGGIPIASEIELKLRFSPLRLREVMALPLLSPARGSVNRKLAATYFDTPTLELRQRRIAFRVRREGRRWVQAVKDGGSAASGVHQRLEIENVLRDPHPDVSVLPRHPVTKFLASRKVAESLQPVLHTEITRSLRLLEPAPGVLIEAAIDRGVIRSGRRREKICEIELELKSGPVSALFDLAQQLAQAVPMALEHRSKAERGYQLFRAEAAPVKAVPVVLTREMTTGQAFLRIAAVALAQVHGNERGVIHSKDSEYLHQMRVGIRRLRSAFSLFRDVLDETAMPQATALRTIAGALGPARDWDVFVTETLPVLRPALAAHVAAEAFEAVCRKCRQSAREKSKKSIKTIDYNNSMIVLGGWLASLDSDGGSAAWRQPVRGCAVRILAARHARVLKRGRHLERRTAAELHRLRIAVKQLRYATEFFSSLFPGRGMAALRGRLTLLQDILGRINDATAVQPLLSAAAAEDRELIAAAGIVTGWCEAHAAAERKKLQMAWRRFRAARRPWLK